MILIIAVTERGRANEYKRLGYFNSMHGVRHERGNYYFQEVSMSRYIDADILKERIPKDIHEDVFENCSNCELLDDEQVKELIDLQPTADVVEGDKAQKEIDYWHDKAQSYEQTILKLSLNKADVVEVVRCKDCRHFRDRKLKLLDDIYECDLTGLVTKPDNYCNYGEGV